MTTGLRRTAVLALAGALGCNGGLEPAPTCSQGFVGICGTVTFEGTEPDSTDGVFIVAYSTFPQSRNDLLTFQPFPPPPSLARPFRGSQIYALPLSTGRYEWVVAVWKKVGAFAPGFSNADSLLKEAGFYHDPTDPTAPGVVVVNDSSTDSVNFVIDFGNLHPICTYFRRAREGPPAGGARDRAAPRREGSGNRRPLRVGTGQFRAAV